MSYLYVISVKHTLFHIYTSFDTLKTNSKEFNKSFPFEIEIKTGTWEKINVEELHEFCSFHFTTTQTCYQESKGILRTVSL